MYWIKIDKTEDMIAVMPCLLRDEYGCVYVGSTAFDYYDSKYWFPLPSLPDSMMPVITNDEWARLALEQSDKDKLL